MEAAVGGPELQPIIDVPAREYQGLDRRPLDRLQGLSDIHSYEGHVRHTLDVEAPESGLSEDTLDTNQALSRQGTDIHGETSQCEWKQLGRCGQKLNIIISH